MDEFIVKATLVDGAVINLKTFGATIEEVVDNLVQMETIKWIEEVVRKKDNASWHLSDKNALSELREMRSQIKDKVLMILNSIKRFFNSRIYI